MRSITHSKLLLLLALLVGVAAVRSAADRAGLTYADFEDAATACAPEIATLSSGEGDGTSVPVLPHLLAAPDVGDLEDGFSGALRPRIAAAPARHPTVREVPDTGRIHSSTPLRDWICVYRL